MALVISVEDTESKKTGQFVFARSPVHLGRSELSDLCLPVPFVSLFHGIVKFQGKTVQYVDTGSKNGSALDGTRMANGVATPIPASGVVTIGTLRLRMSVDVGVKPKSVAETRRSLFGEQHESLDAVAGGTRFLSAPPKLDDLPPLPAAPPPGVDLGPGPTTRFGATRIAQISALLGSDPAPSAAPAPAPAPEPVAPSEGEAGERTQIVRMPMASAEDAAPKRSLREEVRAKAAVAQAPAPAPIVRTEAVDALVGSIQGDYGKYRDAFSRMMREIETRLEPLSAEERRSAFALLGARYPALLQEWPFREKAKENGYEKPAPGTPAPAPIPSVVASDSMKAEMERAARAQAAQGQVQAPAAGPRMRDEAALKPVEQFAEAYAPKSPPMRSADDVARFLDRVAQVLEAFAKSFVEMRKGQEQFAAEMAVSVGSDETPLDRAKNLAQVLSYLLEESEETFVRVEELTRAFADLMIHQVALLNGVRAGAKGLLDQLGPEALERQGARQRSNAGLRAKMFGKKTLWERFLERREELLEDESQLSQALLGPEFAKAYTAVAGGAFDDD